MWGKFVRSGAMQYRHSPDPELKAILDSAVKDILAAERSNGSISCVPVERQPAGGDGVTRPDCGDLWERKYVMLGLEDYYAWVEKDPAVLDEAVTLMSKSGSIDYARNYAENLTSIAKNRLIDMIAPSPSRDMLISMADWFVSRLS